MKDAVYFFSDAHLGLANYEHSVKQENALLEFFDYTRAGGNEIFIVGDLFDSWIEYRQVVPKGHYRLLSKIYEMVSGGMKVTYLRGNHDFWRGKYFKEEFGIDTLQSPVTREIGGRKFYIHHGDGLAYKDTGYKILKAVLSNRVSQFLYSWVHPDIGLWLAKKTSAKSRTYTSNKDYSAMDGLKDFALKKLEEDFDFVIMGHRHKPVMTAKGKGHYVNLGDWFRNFSYGEFKNGKFLLKKFYDLESGNTVNEVINESN